MLSVLQGNYTGLKSYLSRFPIKYKSVVFCELNIIFAFTLCFAVFTSTPAFAWTYIGHAKITENVISSLPQEQQKFYKEIAGRLKNNGGVALLGTWADEIRDEKLQTLFPRHQTTVPKVWLKDAKQNSKRWHYHNTFIASNALRKSEKHCDVENYGELLIRLEQIHNVLFSEKISLTPQQEALLLAFQVHFLQDLHQPLHLLSMLNESCEADLGGNKVCLEKKRKRCEMNLHRLWDGGFSVFDKLAPVEAHSTKIASLDFDLDAWVKATLAYAPKVYGKNTIDHFQSSAYRQASQKIVRSQVMLAQVRLQRYLNAFYLHRQNKK